MSKNKKEWSEEKVKEFGEYELQGGYGESQFTVFAKDKKIIDVIPVQKPFLVYLVRYRELKKNEQET